MAGPRGPTYRFGPFTLDSSRRTLLHGDTRVLLNDRQMSALLCLLENPGALVTKDQLIAAVWGGVAVDDNSIVQVIKRLREALAMHPGGEKFIEAVPRQGYRFVEPVADDEPEPEAADVDALLAPYKALMTSRAAIESFKLDGIKRALQLLVGALKAQPKFDGTMIAMAAAMFLGLESRRQDEEADSEALITIERLARGACAVRPKSGYAWIMFGMVRHRRGDRLEALAALRKAVDLEPDMWLHRICHAYVSAGDERLQAATRALDVCAGVAYAHWFAATVYVPRGMTELALEHARRGGELQDVARPGNLPAVGLHWLTGALLDSMGDEAGALAEFRRELEFEKENHIFGREACANCWYHIGAIHLRNGRHQLATSALAETLKRVPTHARALAASDAAAGRIVHVSSLPDVGRVWTLNPPKGTLTNLDSIIDTAVILGLQRKHADAARLCCIALEQAAPGAAGWQLPLEPILRPAEHLDVWAPVLALLRERAR